jgi:hypothetical protein
MRKFKIDASDGEVLTGYIPESWREVPFRKYVDLAATAQKLPDTVTNPTAHVFASVAGCKAMAPLLGLPTAEPFLQDTQLLLPIFEVAPWLFLGPLPLAEDLVTSFKHQGVTYAYAGGLDGANGGQMEALLAFLRESDNDPVSCGPQLLAVLYTPKGQAQTPQTVRDAADAFETLPMNIAWPCLQNFIVRSMPLALPIQRYLALRPSVEQALSALEEAAHLPVSALRGRSWSMRRWLGRIWLRHVRRILTISSLPSATTAKPRRLLASLKLRVRVQSS